MGNWRKLGEVPDSDDEGLDSQGIASDEAAVPTEPTRASQSKETAICDDDVWEIPSSPQGRGSPETPQKEASSPAKPAHIQPLMPSSAEDGDSASRNGGSRGSRNGNPPLSDRLVESIHEASPSLSNQRRSVSEVDSSQRVEAAAPSQSRSPALQIVISDHMSPRERLSYSTLADGHPERSLRPRKPIQEHPYLLENAQYHKFMKSHGVRPVRVVAQNDNTAKGQGEEEDSQEQEFTLEESQLASVEKEPGQSEGRQNIQYDNFLDDFDELQSSTPPRPPSAQHRLPTSSDTSDGEQTDETSLAAEDELPSIVDLVRKPAKDHSRVYKRRSSTRSSLQAKRPKTLAHGGRNVTSPPRLPPGSRLNSPRSERTPGQQEEAPNTALLSLSNSPTPIFLRSTLDQFQEDRTDELSPNESEAEEDDDSNQTDSCPESESESDIIRKNSKRLRGLLPASWLRFDLQKSRDAVRRVEDRRTGPQSPERAPRRGLAVPRQGKPQPHLNPAPLFEDSDDDGKEGGEMATLRIQDAPATASSLANQAPDDDAASAMEEDIIDAMYPGRKRRRPSVEIVRSAKRRKPNHSTIFKGSRSKRSRQPKITGVLSRANKSASLTATRDSASHSTRKAGHGPRMRPPKHAQVEPPPLLSILDFLEPDVPRFIRVAARTAKSRVDLGKSSPTRKSINLGNRGDNIEALSVLRDWKMGRIQPKVARPARKMIPRTPVERAPLQAMSPNKRSILSVARLKNTKRHSQKPARQTRIDGFVPSLPDDSETREESTREARGSNPVPKRTKPASRPAQLETVAQDRPGNPGFVAKKRALDAVYRRRNTFQPLADVRLEQFVESHVSTPEAALGGEAGLSRLEEAGPIEQVTQRRTQFRKRYLPRRVDTAAPHFVHATDPLPFESVTLAEPVADEADKLLGLGPFGSHYTLHFETFPLEPGSFFHESTLIGNGCLNDAIDGAFLGKLHQSRPGLTFQLGEQTLRWASWDETASSELGILLDLIAEQAGSSELPDSGSNILGAATFILKYVQTALSFTEGHSRKSFTSRCLEVLTSFIARWESSIWLGTAESSLADTRIRCHLDVLIRLFLVSYLALRVCRDSPASLSESFQLEKCLTELAKLCIKASLRLGLEDVRATYDDLQRLSFRERGIRSDRSPVISWVILMRVLGDARLPRAGFWDITYSVLLSDEISSQTDANKLEHLWRKVFTLLPLGEFDDSGVLVGGQRHIAPLEGWAVPQLILRRVFHLYRANPRQSASFNEYCRALVGRCHFLVQEWGWRRCGGVIGVVFDFFGSQSLANLRNEEVYKSPRFLDQLDNNPALSIESEDRCFHVFLKTVALNVLRLRQLGQTNDIRNLVARTLPNHNRQYSKEKTVRQQDLAALRNHHDLLCTLFWVAPPEMRPSVRVIEKLVSPGSSHKEACLINLRAWNQLARFLAGSGEGGTSYRSLLGWQNNVFQQVLEQYLSAASDIQQQLSVLSKDVSRDISPETVKAVVSKNKAAAMDVLHFSAKSSLDVLQRATSLEAATCYLNTVQLDLIFTKLDLSCPDSDWSIVLVALEIVEKYLDRLEKALDEQYSPSSQPVDTQRAEEDALLLMDHKLAAGLFSTARTLSSLPTGWSLSQANLRASCVEKAVVVSARLASRFIHAGITRLSRFFAPGQYCVFEQVPQKLALSQGRCLPLFVATLIKNNVFDFKDLGTTILELWMLSIVKPAKFLGYENYLGETLQQQGLPCLDKAFVPVGVAPGYKSNRNLFTCAMASIRRSLRGTSGAQRQRLRGESAKTLRSVMERLKDDLASVKRDPTAHGQFVMFVREVVTVIKSHGGDVCAVDAFFLQMSEDYSPPLEDPELQTAGIVAYGIRLGEGDGTAIPQLFYYLYSNFRMAVAHGKAERECRILAMAMENDDVLSFVLGKMLPAAMRAVGEVDEAWPLLDVYCGALERLLTRSCVPKEIGEGDMAHVVGLVEAVMDWLRGAAARKSSSGSDVSKGQIHILSRLSGLAGLLQPTTAAYSCVAPEAMCRRLQTAGRALSGFAQRAAAHVGAALEKLPAGAVGAEGLFGDVTWEQKRCSSDDQVDMFCRHIVGDVRQCWAVGEGTVAIKMPGKAGAGGSGAWLMGDCETLHALLQTQGRLWQTSLSTTAEGEARLKKRRASQNIPVS